MNNSNNDDNDDDDDDDDVMRVISLLMISDKTSEFCLFVQMIKTRTSRVDDVAQFVRSVSVVTISYSHYFVQIIITTS